MEPGQAGRRADLPRKVGNYRIEERLGAGGMGVVYRAFDETLERSVAIKHLLSERAHPSASQRFRREALLAARLNHPAVVHIYDIVATEAGDWIVMELVEGQTLSTRIREGGLGLALAVRLGRQIAEGLAEAHAQGIIHRDLKAANIMITAAGRAKILDFGLARLVQQSGASELSQAGTVLGTCHAMSPEQVAGLPLDHRSDLFSFGSLLYEVLTGTSPFRAATIPETLSRICKIQHLPASLVQPDIPQGLSDYLDQLLSKDPDRRPQSTAEVARFLARIEKSGLSEDVPGSATWKLSLPEASGLDLTGEATLIETLAPGRPRTETTPVAAARSAPLDPARSSGERRQITVVCCEAMSTNRNDPEAVYEAMLQLRALTAAVVSRYEGYLGSVMGQRWLIYFGYPQTHEDNARRAVRAALDLVERASQMETGTAWGHSGGLTLRAGIHTGPAIVSSSPESPEPVTLGATLDLTLELQASAEPGSVVVSLATSTLIQKSFVLEPLAPLHTAFRVTGPIEAPEESAVSLLPLVGRQGELDLLLSRWSLARNGMGQVVLISGEPGIGKSHLVRALRERLSEGAAQWVSCYGSPYAKNSPLHPVVGLLRRAIEKIDRESPLDQLESFLGQHAQAEALPLFAPLLGIPFESRADVPPLPPERQREKTLDALVALTLEMAERQPLLLLIEDLHWLDPTTIGWLERLIDQAPSVPLLLVMTVRLQMMEMQWGPRAHLTSISLGPLSGGEAERLVDRVIDWVAGGKPLAESLRRQIVARTDGVPLFLEELTRAVLESAESGETRELPATLRDSLTARLDRLGAAKEVAQLAAVIGRSFSLELLAAVSAIPEATLQRELRHLVQAELIYRRGFGNQTRYFFKHALVQDAAYDSLLKKEQQQIHLHIAEAIASHFPEIAAEQPEVLAHHFSEGNDPGRAVPHWHEAGQKALARFANAEAIHHLEKGQSLLQRLPPGPERDGQDLRFQGALVPAIIATQGFGSPAVERAFQRGIELCERLGAPSFQLLWGLFGFYSVCRAPAKALEVGRQMLQIAEAQDNIPYKVQSHYGLGGTCFPDGNLHESLEHIRAALSYDEPDIGRTLILTFGSDDRKVAAAYQGPLLWLLGSPAEALERSRAAIAWAREEPSPFTLSTVLLLSCFLHLFRKEELIVQAYAEEMIHLCEEHNLFQIRDARVMLACAMVETPDGEEWIPRLREGIEIYRASGFQVFLTFYLGQLAAACLRFGRFVECEAALQEALRLSEDNQELFWAAEIHRLAGDLALARGESPERVEDAYRRALGGASRQSAKSLELRAATSLARLWARLRGEREPGRVRDLLAGALQGVAAGQETADVKEAAAVLSVLA